MSNRSSRAFSVATFICRISGWTLQKDKKDNPIPLGWLDPFINEEFSIFGINDVLVQVRKSPDMS